MNEIRKFFDIRHVYVRLMVVVSLVVFAFVGWWSIRQSVKSHQKAQLDEEIEKLERRIDAKMLLVLNAVRQTKSFLNFSKIKSSPKLQDAFEEYVLNLNAFETVAGLVVVGYAKKDANDTRVIVRAVAPLDSSTAKAIGYDFMGDDARSQAIQSASLKNDIHFTTPIEFYFKHFEGKGVLGFLPDDKRDKVTGYVFFGIHARQFFDGLLGSPDPEKEKIAFDIVVKDGGKESILYRRFDLSESLGEARVRNDFNPLLQGWSIQARPLPGMFGFFDSQLHNLFALIAICLIASIGWSLQSSVSQMQVEENSRRQLVDSEKRVKDYLQTLLKLNVSIRGLLSEMTLEKILPAIVSHLKQGLTMDLVAIYLRDDQADRETKVEFALRHAGGTLHEYDLVKRVTLGEIWEISSLRDVFYSSKHNESFHLAKLLISKGDPESIVILPFVDQTETIVGFALMISPEIIKGRDESMDAFLTGLIKPIGVALRNSQLYSDAQEAAHSKTAFLANMSHEIRTPLGAIVGFSDLLCDETDPHNRRHLMENIRRNSKLLTRIIDDILDFSRFELSQPVLAFKTVNLSTLISEVQAVVLMLAQEKKIALKFAIPGDLPDQVDTDDVRVKQILLNLIGNAIKFTDHGHVLAEVNHDATSGNLIFRISDTGAGISQEVRERLFRPFTQGDNTNTRRFGGTGLGLVLSRKLAQALGGDVKLVASEVGRGSVFEAIIPTRPQSGSAVSDVLSDEAGNSQQDVTNVLMGKQILLVEDSVDNQEIFTLFLTRAGAHVDLARSGDEALIKAATHEYDLILMDIQLPIMDGKQATRILRRRDWKKPIIALTAHALEDERMAVVQAGCDGQITKPVTGSALVFAVKRYLEASDQQIG